MNNQTATPTSLAHWLAATYLPDIGPVKFLRCLQHFADIESFFAASAPALQQAGLTEPEITSVQNPDWDAVEKDLRWGEQTACHLLTRRDPRYPNLLQELSHAPLVLYVRGHCELLAKPQLAIVGSRNPSKLGAEIAEEFAKYLSQAGLVITSGLALGVDAASHRGALNGSGETIAVTGTGLNRVYPKSHHQLAQQILERGALVSEFSPDMPAIPENFPRRNRIISGLSLGTLVVEAALRSGSLITARYAADQGREVFAIPGSIHNPLARGCHYLIRQGAKLVETATDIIEELGALNAAINTPKNQPISAIGGAPGLDAAHRALLTCIDDHPTSLDTVISRSGLTVKEVSSMLLLLELQNYIVSVPGGYARITRKK